MKTKMILSGGDDIMLERVAVWISESFMKDESELERAKFKLGTAILLHDTSMIFIILMTGYFCGVLWQTILVFVGFGCLRIYAGGFHFKKSWQCLVGTGVIVIGGAFGGSRIIVSVGRTILIYLILIAYMAWKAPKRTKNNPLDEEYYMPFKVKSMCVLLIYLILGLFVETVNSYLIIASVCESVSLLIEC